MAVIGRRQITEVGIGAAAVRALVGRAGEGARRTTNKKPSQTNDGLSLNNLGLDRDTVSRWRKKLKDPGKFDEELECLSAAVLRLPGITRQRHAIHAYDDV